MLNTTTVCRLVRLSIHLSVCPSVKMIVSVLFIPLDIPPHHVCTHTGGYCVVVIVELIPVTPWCVVGVATVCVENVSVIM